MSYQIDKAANTVIQIAAYGQRLVRTRPTDATCPKCGERLSTYYCENRTFAVKCGKCETVTLVKARNSDTAAMHVGIVAIPLDEWIEDDGDVIATRFPVRDTSDVCIGHPLDEPPTIPEDFTHFINLPLAIRGDGHKEG